MRQLQPATLILALFLSACQITVQPRTSSTPEATPTSFVSETPTPFQPPDSLATEQARSQDPSPTPQPTAAVSSVWIHPGYPVALGLPDSWTETSDRPSAMVRIEPGVHPELASWVYALAAAFPTIQDEVSSAELQAAWRGGGPVIFLSGKTAAVFVSLWGEPDGEQVRVVAEAQLLDRAWRHANAWALLPFEMLEPRWKVLAVDGQSPVRRDFDPQVYALTVPFGPSGAPETVDRFLQEVAASGSPASAATNRESSRLTTVILSGVTALVRATAWTMERQGILYPAQDIGPWLREADITHISNEVPFAENCPPPIPNQPDLIFCSDPRYLALLEDIGTDVVELTGDHFHDWGTEAMYLTLELYDQLGWPYYGGGATFQEGRQAVLFEHNGNKIAFIGCNGKGGTFARADESTPGAVRCDFDWLRAEIGRLSQDGYQVIFTFQHIEYYSYWITERMADDFRAVADAGAAIVSGSQAHHPHGFEFYGDSFIHYGLGNLFFDQLSVETATGQAFIDRHVFYDGRHISTELLTLIFEDYARSRPMTSIERTALLENVFSASGWSHQE